MADAGWTAEPGRLWARCWDRLAEGAADGHAPARVVALASTGRDGGPRARMVVLRRADRARAVLDVHCDTASAKVAELQADARAAILLWLAADSLQIRLHVRVTVLTGAAVDAIWAAVPATARVNYGGIPLPGDPLDGPASDPAGAPDPARFAVLRCQVTAADLLHLGRDRHRRAAFARNDRFAGQWIAP